MKGLNLIILLLSDLSILGANDVQYVLPGEFIFIPTLRLRRCFGDTRCIPARPSSQGAALSLTDNTRCAKARIYTLGLRLRGLLE